MKPLSVDAQEFVPKLIKENTENKVSLILYKKLLSIKWLIFILTINKNNCVQTTHSNLNNAHSNLKINSSNRFFYPQHRLHTSAAPESLKFNQNQVIIVHLAIHTY